MIHGDIGSFPSWLYSKTFQSFLHSTSPEVSSTFVPVVFIAILLKVCGVVERLATRSLLPARDEISLWVAFLALGGLKYPLSPGAGSLKADFWLMPLEASFLVVRLL